MSGITTHILDIARGRPAAGIAVTLEIRDGVAWKTIGGGTTDADGRCRTLTPSNIAPGTYRITFDVATYNTDGFFPHVAIEFHVRDAAQHYHVPLLLSPFGYSTYRGS
ncbi:MAG TPA: hydroxyisourate hydrolase [Thermoanaerobaculia bacterium]|nr:hydroxyisourate hydrolase [Thermoanaerobaculia bacterium]